MASTIISRTFSAVQDNRAVLDNSNFVRPFNAGNWNKLRVCIRFSVRDTIALSPTTFTQPANFAIGLCSGSTNIFIGTTTQFIGAVSNIGTGGQLVGMGRTHPAANPTSYIVSVRLFPARKLGAVLTGATEIPTGTLNNYWTSWGWGQYDGPSAPSAGPRRTLMFADITRPNSATVPTSGEYIVNTFCQGVAGGFQTDASISDFQAQAITPTPVFTDHVVYNPGVGMAGNELTLGTLDHICVAWNNAQNPIEISDVGFVKML